MIQLFFSTMMSIQQEQEKSFPIIFKKLLRNQSFICCVYLVASIADRLDCLSDLKNPTKSSLGIEIYDKLLFFVGDHHLNEVVR